MTEKEWAILSGWLISLQFTTIVPVVISILALVVSFLSYRHTRQARQQIRQLETASRKGEVLVLLERAWLTHIETRSLYSRILNQLSRFQSLEAREQQLMHDLAADREQEQKAMRELELIRTAVETDALPRDEMFFEEQIPQARAMLAAAEALNRAAQTKANAWIRISPHTAPSVNRTRTVRDAQRMAYFFRQRVDAQPQPLFSELNSNGYGQDLARTCPICGSYLGIVIADPEENNVRSVRGRCAVCGYAIAWTLIRS